MKNLVPYMLFEGMEPVRQVTEITLVKEVNPDVSITVTLDNMNKIVDVRSPGGIRHIFNRGNVLNKKRMEDWMTANGFIEKNRTSIKKQLKGNELIKFMMKRGYR